MIAVGEMDDIFTINIEEYIMEFKQYAREE